MHLPTLVYLQGTAAWKKQVRHMVAQDAEGHADDIFDSTPFKSTPFKNLTAEAGKLGALARRLPLAAPASACPHAIASRQYRS